MYRAARIAIREVRAFLEGNASVERVTLVCFEERGDLGVAFEYSVR